MVRTGRRFRAGAGPMGRRCRVVHNGMGWRKAVAVGLYMHLNQWSIGEDVGRDQDADVDGAGGCMDVEVKRALLGM